MRIWYDTEFIEDGRTIELISIGMVREDDAELYFVSDSAGVMRRAVEHDWLRENVVPGLPVTFRRRPLAWDWDQKHADNPRVPQQADGQHNALADARHNRVIADILAARA